MSIRHFISALLFILAPIISHAQQEITRNIEQISGDLYRFQHNFHYSVFLVTEEGVIVTDPINAAAASWLKNEIHDRFNKPIKYVIYSHDHADHIAGGEVFDPETLIISHQNTKQTILGENRPTAVPELTFNDRMTLELGGQQVELIYVGRGHSDNSIVMHFPAYRALFAVDFISVDRMPYQNLSDSYFPDWIEAIKRVESIDFDILVPGHGSMGEKADATEHRLYLEALYEGVLSASREGKTLEEVQQSLQFPEFSHFGQYEAWLPLNIEGMFNQIKLHRRGN